LQPNRGAASALFAETRPKARLASDERATGSVAFTKRFEKRFAVLLIAYNFTSRPDILDVGKFGIPSPSFNCRMACASQSALRD
jgi:hypothetical protein